MGKLNSELQSFQSTRRQLHEHSLPSVQIQEVLHPADLRSLSDQARVAKQKEIKGLVRRGTWQVVLKE